jgi:hypothetical protein
MAAVAVFRKLIIEVAHQANYVAVNKRSRGKQCCSSKISGVALLERTEAKISSVW